MSYCYVSLPWKILQCVVAPVFAWVWSIYVGLGHEYEDDFVCQMYYHSDHSGVVYIATYFFMVYNGQYIVKVFSTLFTVM